MNIIYKKGEIDQNLINSFKDSFIFFKEKGGHKDFRWIIKVKHSKSNILSLITAVYIDRVKKIVISKYVNQHWGNIHNIEKLCLCPTSLIKKYLPGEKFKTINEKGI